MLLNIFLILGATCVAQDLTVKDPFAYYVTLGPMPNYLLNYYPRYKAPYCYANETAEHRLIADIFKNTTKLSSSDLQSYLKSNYGVMGTFALRRMRKIAELMVSCRKRTWEWIKKKSPKQAALTLLKCRSDIRHYRRFYESDMRIFRALDHSNYWWVETTITGIFDEAVRYSKNIIERFQKCLKEIIRKPSTTTEKSKKDT